MERAQSRVNHEVTAMTAKKAQRLNRESIAALDFRRLFLETSCSGRSAERKARLITTTSYSSTDGQNLAQLSQVPVGTYSADLCSFNLPAGNYQVSVPAVGEPSMSNRMPGRVSYTPSCGH